MFGYVLHDTNVQNHGKAWYPLERKFYGHPSAGLPWERQFEEAFLGTWMGENSELRMYVRSSETGVISVSVCGCDQNGWKEAEYGSHVEEIDEHMDIDDR